MTTRRRGDATRKPPQVSEQKLSSAIGGLLKSLRADANLSLEQLSKRAGVSRGMLSQIELGQSVPTITILTRIAAAFNLPAAAFLAEELPGRALVLKREEAHLLRSADGKFVSRALFPFRGPRRTEFYELSVEPGCRYESAAHPAATSENLLVSVGVLEIEISGERHRLGVGDALYMTADRPHVYCNPGNEVATAYLVMSFAQPISY